MIINSLKLFFRYSERALTPNTFSALIQQKIKDSPLKEIIHQLRLYERQILIFDYDYYQRICYRLLDFQKQMKTQDILMILNLGQRHQLKNNLLWKHYQAQIHNRLHRQMFPVLEHEKKQYQIELSSALKQLEKNSQDFFDVLKDQQKQVQEESQVTNNQSSEIGKYQYNKYMNNPTSILPKINNIADILILFGTQRIQLLKLMLEAQSHPQYHITKPQSVIKYAEILNYTCQILLQKYQKNKVDYTPRSIKKIFKFQGFYMPSFFKMFEQQAQNFKIEEIKHLLQVLGSFPIKKRENKRKIVHLITNQIKNRNLDIKDFSEQIQALLDKDKKLILKFKMENKLLETQTNISE